MVQNKDEQGDDETRVQVPIKPAYLARVDELAERMGVGRGRMVAMLLEAGVDDNEWIIRVVTSRFAQPLVNLVKGWKGKDKDKTKGA